MQFRYLDTIQNPGWRACGAVCCALTRARALEFARVPLVACPLLTPRRAPCAHPAPLAEHMDAGRFQKVTAMAWSPNGMRLAVATVSRRIHLYDADGKERDSFPTKPVKGGPRNYIIRELAFSPDGTRLAVAQSDCIVYVYKLGANWKDRKSICAKYERRSPITCCCWPSTRPNNVVFGTADGGVYVGTISDNKIHKLALSCESFTVSMSASPGGNGFVCGHLDGRVQQYVFKDRRRGINAEHKMLFKAPFAPYCLSHGVNIAVAGNTGQVKFYDASGNESQTFTYSLQPSKDSDSGSSAQRSAIKEFSVARFNPSGTTVVMGNYSCFFTFVFNANTERWEEAPVTHIENLYSIKALCWKPDGSRLATGSLCGAVDLYDACIRRFRYKGKWEITFTSPSSLIIKSLSTGDKTAVRSKFKHEIKKSDVYADRYFVGRTPETMILADLEAKKVSEIPWAGSSGKEKFYFDNPNVCMVFSSGELSIVQYGDDEVLGQVRTEHMNPHLISTRISEPEEKVKVKKVAFLLDEQSIRILDLLEGYASQSNVTHDTRIDWLELNVKGTKLLFRDRSRTLHLYDTTSRTRTTLLNFCSYVQWVPNSDAVVAQSRNILYVWYRIEQPDQVVTKEIKGDIEEIERNEEKTSVLISDGTTATSYTLDADLIAFDEALDDMRLARAMRILEVMDTKNARLSAAAKEGKGVTPTTADTLKDKVKSRDSMWQQLAKCAVERRNFAIAERCYAALGDVSKSRYMRSIKDLQTEHGADNYMVAARMAMFKKQFKKAEAVYMDNGRIDCSLSMYRRLFKWNEALALSRDQNHRDTAKLVEEYFEFLTSTNQQEIAGELKEQEGDYMTALRLYLDGGFPAKAARVVTSQRLTDDAGLLEKVGGALLAKKMNTQAGKYFERLNFNERSLQAYLDGNNFNDAVQLCRKVFPERVVQLQEQWGDYLARRGQMDAACGHYIEAGSNMKAINAAIEAKQWKKAIAGLDNVDEKVAQPYYRRIAEHYKSIGELDEAERFYMQGQLPMPAVEMYLGAGKWAAAERIARVRLSKADANKIFLATAQRLEKKSRYRDASNLYVKASEPDRAIDMFKRLKRYDDMIDLVKEYRPGLLGETHLQLAKDAEARSDFKSAERHFLAAEKWQMAVDMYRVREMWEDALRVAKRFGEGEYQKIAYYFVLSVSGDEGSSALKFIRERGLGELAVQHALKNGEFSEATFIAGKSCKHKLVEVHYQYALALEDEGHFERAEEEFIKANKPKEAIDMYNHQHSWKDAMRVAREHDPNSISTVFEEQGRVAKEEKQYAVAEEHFVKAENAHLAIQMYKELNKWDEAIRVARKHVPTSVSSLQMDREQYITNVSDSNSIDYVRSQAKLLEQSKKYSEAIDAYLRVEPSMCSSKQQLVQMYDNAWRLAAYTRDRRDEVAVAVANKLVAAGVQTRAAAILREAGRHDKAVEALMRGNMYDEARSYARKYAPSLAKAVDQKHQRHLVQGGNTDRLAQVNPGAAIDMYAKAGDWPQVYALAQKQGETAVIRCASMEADGKASAGDAAGAVEVLAKYGVSSSKATIGAYVRVCKAVLADGAAQGNGGSSIVPDSHVALRPLLRKIVRRAAESKLSADIVEELRRYDRIMHLSAVRRKCEEAKLNDLVAKQCVALLRYTDVIPVDVSFYNAGTQCKQEDREGMAFVFFNRFVDYTDLIGEEDDDADIDETEFKATDIPPFAGTVPERSNYDDDTIDEIRDLALEAGMSGTVQKLPLRRCTKCSKQTYVASLTCNNCNTQSPECVVTGWPVLGNNMTSCPSCDQLACKDMWNRYVLKFKHCPWCDSRASAVA